MYIVCVDVLAARDECSVVLFEWCKQEVLPSHCIIVLC